ncbi:MAG: PIN domain-containing protein [Actinomycetota bacterium]
MEPTIRVDLLADEPDNRLIEAALTANADFIVTGDRELLEMGSCNGTRVVSARDFLTALGHPPPGR